ncbi:MAG: hypothetical protein M3N52_12915 [Actinomycetota bacterium]|nr:hypothetical protein [Actinomycetota bacterium]
MTPRLRSRRRWPRRRLGALALLAGLVLAALSATAWAQQEPGATVDVIEVSGVVDPAMARYLTETVAKAEREGSEVVVVQLDTPGGLGVSLDEIVETIGSSRVPVVVWVGPRGAQATSLGTFIAYAAHVLALAPGATIGAAVPVDLGAATDEQVRDDVEAALTGLARLRGRGDGFARAAAQGTLVAVAPASSVPDPAALGAEEVESLSPRALIDRRIADFVAASLPDVLGELDGRTVRVAAPGGGSRFDRLTVDEERARVRFHSLGLVGRVLHTLANPTLAYLLLIGGALALLFEVFQPGFGVAGVSGLAMLAMGLYGLWVLPVNWLAFGLLTVGLLLLAADLAVAGLGAATVGGTLALAAGSFLLFDGPALLRVSAWLVLAVVTATVAFFVLVMTTVLRAQAPPTLGDAEGLVGQVGVVRSVLNPQGHVFVAGALWRARAPGPVAPVKTGTRVRVVGSSDASTLDVEPADQSSPVA